MEVEAAPIPALVLRRPLQAVKVEYANVPEDIKQDWEDGVKFLGVRESFRLHTSKLTLKQFCCACGEGGSIIYCDNKTCGLPYCSKCLSELVVPDGATFICSKCWRAMPKLAQLSYSVSLSCLLWLWHT
jgi:hypothetical protein